jgi:hypothetical protein
MTSNMTQVHGSYYDIHNEQFRLLNKKVSTHNEILPIKMNTL